MAIYTGFFNSNPEAGLVRKYDAEDISRLFDGLIGDGVLETVGEKLIVKPNNGMVVSVGTGRAWFSHCWIRNDSKLDLTVPESDPLLPRKDTVVLEVNHNLNVLDCSIKIITGAPAAVPVAATLEDTEYIKQVPLAYISVAAGATEVVITDLTNCVGTSACPFVIGIASFMTIDDFVAQWGAEWTAWLATKGTQYDNMFTAKSEQFDAWFLAKNDAWTDFMTEKNTEWTAWLAQQSTTLQNIQNEINSFTQTLITGVMCTDVNDTFDTGNYGINAQTQGTLPTGVSAGSMEVINSPSGNTKQVLYPDSGENIIYTRSYDSSTEAWSTWKAASGGGGGGTAGGSIIKVTTTETSLHNKNVTITNGTESASATFDGNGVAVIEGFTGVGSCTISASDGYLAGEKSITIPYFGNYTETISLWKATVTITVQDAYDGQTVEIKDEHMTPIAAVDCTAAAGGATWTANAPGTYIFSVMIGAYPDTATVDASLIITDEGEYSVELSYIRVYGFKCIGPKTLADTDPSVHISYDVKYRGVDVINKNYTPISTTNGSMVVDNLTDWADAFFMPDLVVDHGDGVTGKGLSMFKLASGVPGMVTTDDSNGWALDGGRGRILFAKFPKIWIKIVPDMAVDGAANGISSDATVYIADRQLDSDFHDWAYYDDNDVEHDSLFVGSTSAWYSNGRCEGAWNSSSSTAAAGISTVNEGVSHAHARSNDYLTYSVENGAIASMMTVLTVLITKTLNIQSVMGIGNCGDTSNNEGAGVIWQNANNNRGGLDMLFVSPRYNSNGTPVLFGIEHIWGDRNCYLNRTRHTYGDRKYYFHIDLPNNQTASSNGVTADAAGAADGLFDMIDWSDKGVIVYGGNKYGSSMTSSGIVGDAKYWGANPGVIAIGGRAGNSSGWGERAGLFATDCSGGDGDYGFSWWGRVRWVAWPKEVSNE